MKHIKLKNTSQLIRIKIELIHQSRMAPKTLNSRTYVKISDGICEFTLDRIVALCITTHFS